MYRRIPIVLLSVLFSGCSYYDASLLNPIGGSSGDAGLDVINEGGDDIQADVVDALDAMDAMVVSDVVSEDGDAMACWYARPPEPPTSGQGGGDIEFIVAVYDLDFGDRGGNPKEIGYDLDSRCTCQGEGNGCLRESWATADACDGPGGRDNAAGALFADLAPLFGSKFGSEAFSEAAFNGEWSLVLRVRGYNGLPDDDQVQLDWYVTDQYWEDKADSNTLPAWDGNDTWPIRSTALLEQDGGALDFDWPRYFDPYAYVSGGVLVGSFPESAFQVTADYTMEFNGTFVTANVVEGTHGWELQNGIMASRWKLSSILSQVGRITIFGLPVCMDHLGYPGLKAQLCAYADIFSGVATPTTPCDSISSGLKFETKPAKFGNIIPSENKTGPCDPSVDPANDSCGS